MTRNEEFLQYVYQNAKMAKSTIDQILKIVEDIEFKDILEEQISDYESIIEKVEAELESLKTTGKNISKMTELITYFNIKMSTTKDNTSSHIAKMMVQGSDMGIIQITENLNKYKRLKPTIRQLGKKLLEIEENNSKNLKKYL